ncbi:MAG: hypothetical protein AAF495_17775 [Pseudomonadota bacterium]
MVEILTDRVEVHQTQFDATIWSASRMGRAMHEAVLIDGPR